MLSSIKAGTAPATLKKVTHRQLVKAAATVRNQTVTYDNVTPLELAFGRRPADLIQLDVATPTQLTIDRNEEELTAIHIKQLSKQAFQEARQSEDIRRDLAQNLRMSSKPLQVKDKVFYWQEDKSKIRSDGSKGGIWLKGKVISIEGAMMSLCRHSRNHVSQFFRLSWYLHHLRFLRIPKQKTKMKILNCQHLCKKN